MCVLSGHVRGSGADCSNDFPNVRSTKIRRVESCSPVCEVSSQLLSYSMCYAPSSMVFGGGVRNDDGGDEHDKASFRFFAASRGVYDCEFVRVV